MAGHPLHEAFVFSSMPPRQHKHNTNINSTNDNNTTNHTNNNDSHTNNTKNNTERPFHRTPHARGWTRTRPSSATVYGGHCSLTFSVFLQLFTLSEHYSRHVWDVVLSHCQRKGEVRLRGVGTLRYLFHPMHLCSGSLMAWQFPPTSGS